ncbi:helix-turn-helix domain-containing protein [Acinetobacter indicus]|uniref:helix-turn-helix domain-containing protein n=1 Tax=Acinetobacter indicus TaxID=756892 RepID=UPI0012E30502|nr:helix-turn-helix domain-containing protein [Acinetobacter indicus]
MNDWSQMINDLLDKDKGAMTQQQIAESISCSQNYISDLKTGKRGKRLSYEIAEGLRKLHEQKVRVAS